jgi:NCAIR mutase (PurE)-related protein
MNRDRLEKILKSLHSDEMSVSDALEQLKRLPFEDLQFAKLDHHRELRRGIPEAIYSPGKTQGQIMEIAQKALDRNGEAVFTRMTADAFGALRESLGDRVRWYPDASIVTVGVEERKKEGKILVITAGTSDIPVAEEAAVTCEILGCEVARLYDVGVAGVHRLTSHLDMLESADVLIVLAGMEGALPSVIAGLTDRPVIAVPTSIGYGASFGGIAALLGMLSSCSGGIGVVNIDNGFGAGALAVVIIRNLYSEKG